MFVNPIKFNFDLAKVIQIYYFKKKNKHYYSSKKEEDNIQMDSNEQNPKSN